MRKLLLNPTPFFRKLRQLSLLLSLLLVPFMAWGQEVSTTYTFTGTSGISNHSGTATSTVTGAGTYRWSIKQFYITRNDLTQDMDPTPIENTLGYSKIGYSNEYVADLTVESDFGITGSFVSATINYTTSGLNSGEVQVYNTNGNYALATGTGNYGKTIMDLSQGTGDVTLSLSYNDHKVFIDDHISFQFTFTPNNTSSFFQINSIMITIGPVEYGLKVENTQVTAANASNILTGANDGKVSFDASSNILTLNDANLTMPIQTDIDNLIIELKGENKINTNAAENAIKRISSNETLNLTIRPASTDPLGSINLANLASSSTSLVDGFNLSLGGELFAYPSLNNSSTHNSYITSLLIGGQMVAKTGSVFSSHNKISFNNASNNNVLTLSGVSSELNSNKIISGLSNLTINYDGANTITMGDTATVITSTNSNSVLTFTKASDASSLTISNTNTRSIIHGFNSINYGDGIYLATSAPTTYINTPNIGLMSALDNTKPINSLLLSSDPTYQLWVAGTQATSTTSGTDWSYDANSNKLTLNTGATITGQIISNLGDLTIHITGTNTIKAANPTDSYLIKSTNNGILTFETGTTIGNQLSFENSSGGEFSSNQISGFTSVAYEAGLGYNSNYSKINEALLIEYNQDTYKLHSSNVNDILGDGGTVSYSYDSTNGHVLTLDGANIAYIARYADDDLTIALKGTSLITSDDTGHTNSINCYGNLKFVKASGANSAELRASTHGGSPFATSNLTLGSGLYLKPTNSEKAVITDNPEFVLYNGYAMTKDVAKTGTTGTVTYSENGSEKTLTFTNFQGAFGDGNNQVNAIETGVAGLKVVLVGDNKITCNDPNTYAFKGIRTDASIKFVKGGDGCKLTMDGNATSNSFSFGEGKVTYDKLVYSDENERIICEPTPPTMGYNDQKKVVMQKDYTDGDIYYTITHADGKTADVAKTKYTAEFAMAAPGTVEAWVEANGATTAKIKGKYFGYKDAPIILNPGETKTPVLIPAIEDGDNIGYAETGAYTSDDTDIATFASGVITAVASGNVNVITTLATTGASVTTVILNYNNQFNTLVKVGTDISGYFEGQNQYGTYYNATDNYTIPAGMEAYVITGVNGNQVVLKSLSVLPKLTPLLLFKGTATTFYSVTTDETDDTSGNLLKRAQGEVNADNNTYYVLYNNEFVKAVGLILNHGHYLDLNSVNPSRGMYSIGDGSTGIRDLRIENGELREEWFDMQGRRIDKPTRPGLYIKNGKKVVVNNK